MEGPSRGGAGSRSRDRAHQPTCTGGTGTGHLRRRKVADHPIRDLLACFDAHYLEQTGVRYPFSPGKDAKLMQGLRALYTDEQIRQFIGAYFASDDPFIQASGYSFGVFRGCLPQLIQQAQGARRPVLRAAPAKASWREDCRHQPVCRTYMQHLLATEHEQTPAAEI